MRNSPDRSTKSTQSHFNVLPQYVNTRFQVLFHSPPGVLFTFPSQYYYSISHQLVFSLTEWSPLVHTGFLVSRATLDTARLHFGFRLRDSHAYRLSFHTIHLSLVLPRRSPNPIHLHVWFGLFPVRSPLLRKSMFLSLPEAT